MYAPMAKVTLQSPFWAAIGLAWQLGYTIALPLVLLALGGRFLDRKLGTTPWLLLVGIALALITSGIGVARKVRAITRADG